VRDDDKVFLFNDDAYMKQCGITFAQIMYLGELGLMHSESIAINIIVEKQELMGYGSGELVMTLEPKEQKPTHFAINVFPLTDVGKELSTLVPYSLSDEKFLSFARLVKTRHGNVDVKVCKALGVADGGIAFDGEDLLE
jgi:hypothetical protein